MQKILLFSLAVLIGSVAYGQPWMPANTNGPVKFSDIVNRYPKHAIKEDNEELEKDKHGKVREEGTNYLFDRWAWYWRQHLDTNGYMVPPMKTLMEWQQYSAAAAKHSAARTTSASSNWVFQGPHQTTGGYAGLGRINVVAFDPVDSNTIYVGSAAGSAWKTTDGGHTWASMYNNLPTLGVADIRINPQNRNTIYIATGDGDAGDAYSSGVIKSYDGGATWQTTGLSWLPTMYIAATSLVINPVDTNTMVLGSSDGIYVTHNAGATWAHVTFSGVKQVLYNPNDTNVLYASLESGSGSSQIMRSHDGGNTWTIVTSFSGAQRINLAVCPTNSSVVMAVAANNNSGLDAVYKSTDTGATYTAVFSDDGSCSYNILGYDLGLPTSNCGGQGWYDLCIAIDPNNAGNVIIGGVNTYYSTDGGASWTICNQWYDGVMGLETVHADKHCLAYNSLTGAIFETCDGGVYKCYGALTEPWTDLTNGIGITEFYKNAVDNGVSFVLGGAQDNGTKQINAGIATDIAGGDGMQCRIDYTDPNNVWYVSYPGGSIDATSNGGVTFNSITGSFSQSGDWVTPYVIHPVNSAVLLLGYEALYASYDYGSTWTPISPTFDPSGNINTIAISYSNTNYIYCVTDDNKIHYSTDFGTTWSQMNAPTSGYISDLVIDPKNENRFWVTMSGYGASKVMRCTLPGGTWVNENGSLPDIPANCMIIDTFSSTKYLGTDAAVYYKDTTMADWALYNTNLPSVHVTDLNINYTTGELWAATFGRGMWKTPKADEPTGIPVLPVVSADVNVYPNPNHGSFTINTPYKALMGQPVTLKLESPDGRIVWQKDAVFDPAGNLKVNSGNLSRGLYICVVSNKNMITRCRILIN